jgi:hypothetical protein
MQKFLCKGVGSFAEGVLKPTTNTQVNPINDEKNFYFMQSAVRMSAAKNLLQTKER